MDERLEKIAKLNYWNGNHFDNGVRRKFYLQRILPFIGNRVIKVIIGQRRAGKSWLMRQIIAAMLDKGVMKPEQVLYINKEFYRFSFLQTPDDLMDLYEAYYREINPKGKTYVFFDEIHNISGWEKVVDSLSQDPSIDCEVFLTGSNSKMLSGELATLLSGRYVEFEVQPFSYNEYLQAYGNREPSRQTMVDYLRTGGLPEFLNLRGEETRRNYVESVKNTILLKDIVERHSIKDAGLLDRIFSFLVNNSSSLVSIGNIVNYLNNEQKKKNPKAKEQNYETVANYIGYLQDAYLILKAERYDVKGKEILKGAAKYYANDNCYHNYLFEGYGYGQGSLLENYVYQVLRRAGYKVYVGKMIDSEVDFVCLNHDRRLYVQSSWTIDNEDTAEREYNGLEAVADSYPKMIVTMDDIPRKIRNGIENIQAWELEQKLSAQ
ncbi:MAG: ATP-binding protein [Prevotella sp.]|jgi:predicted AAA+ superfamily ATPase